MTMADGTPGRGGPNVPGDGWDERENSRENKDSANHVNGGNYGGNPNFGDAWGGNSGNYGVGGGNGGSVPPPDGGRYREENDRYPRRDDPSRWEEYPPKGPGTPRRDPYPGYSGYHPAHTDSKAFCVLSYLGILWIIGLLAGRDDPKVRYHVNQGIILSIFEFAVGILVSIMKSFVTAVFIRLFSGSFFLPQIGMTLNGMISFASGCLAAAYIIIGIVHAAQDRQEPLPIIGTLFTVIS